VRFLADESCDFNVVRVLREDGHDVLAVIEESPGMADALVVERAARDVRIVVTEDKDFGQMVFAALRETSGVVLVRWPADARKSLPAVVQHLVRDYADKLPGAFVVLEPGRIRFGRLP
jgi:predicted nuclease of predicted toxin-antitoxin system